MGLAFLYFHRRRLAAARQSGPSAHATTPYTPAPDDVAESKMPQSGFSSSPPFQPQRLYVKLFAFWLFNLLLNFSLRIQPTRLLSQPHLPPRIPPTFRPLIHLRLVQPRSRALTLMSRNIACPICPGLRHILRAITVVLLKYDEVSSIHLFERCASLFLISFLNELTVFFLPLSIP